MNGLFLSTFDYSLGTLKIHKRKNKHLKTDVHLNGSEMKKMKNVDK